LYIPISNLGVTVDELDFIDCTMFQPLSSGQTNTYDDGIVRDNSLLFLRDSSNKWVMNYSSLSNNVFYLQDSNSVQIYDNNLTGLWTNITANGEFNMNNGQSTTSEGLLMLGDFTKNEVNGIGYSVVLGNITESTFETSTSFINKNTIGNNVDSCHFSGVMRFDIPDSAKYCNISGAGVTFSSSTPYALPKLNSILNVNNEITGDIHINVYNSFNSLVVTYVFGTDYVLYIFSGGSWTKHLITTTTV